MSGVVPPKRGLVDSTSILSGKTVSARTWQSIGSLTNWTLGRGLNVMPAYSPQITLVATNTYSIAVSWEPHYQAKERVWGFHFRNAVANTPGTAKVILPTNVSADISGAEYVAPSADATQTYSPFDSHYVREPIAQASAVYENKFTIEPQNSGDLVWEMANCWELPRPTLEIDADNLGTDLARIRAGQPIRQTDLNAIHATYPNMLQAGWRHFFFWGVPYHDGTSNITSFAVKQGNTSGWVDAFAAGIPTLPRKYYRNASTTNVKLKVYAWNSAGNSGNVRMTSPEAGESSAINITATSPAWSSTVTLATDTEDLTASDGIGSADYFDIQVSNSSGNSTYITSILLWEEV